MMQNYAPLITQAGINASVDADASNIQLKVTQIGFGDQSYVPNRNQTELRNELGKARIIGAKEVGPGHLHLVGVFQANREIPVREVGFYFEDGTLFAVWSAPPNTLFYLTPLSKVTQGFDLVLSGVPVDAITVDASGDFSLIYAPEFLDMTIAQTQTSIAQIQANHRQIQFNDRLLQAGV